MQTIRLFKLF